MSGETLWKSVVRPLLVTGLLLGAGYWYVLEFRNNAGFFQDFKLSYSFPLLLAAVLICTLSYLVEVFVWKIVFSAKGGDKLPGIREIIAILFASGLFRYLPGRIWTCTAQVYWFRQYGISTAEVLYINLVCLVELGLVTLYLGLAYLAAAPLNPSPAVMGALAAGLVLCNLFYNTAHGAVVHRVLALLRRFTGREILPVRLTAGQIWAIQALFSLSWLLTGVSVWLLAKGLALQVASADVITVLAALTISWLAGLLVVIAPAGLGVRENLLLFLLKPVLNVQAALVLPVALRLLTLLAEGLLGLAALWVGWRHRIFFAGDE